jgi:hypothetical protein
MHPPLAALLLPQIWPDILSRRALPSGRLAGLGAQAPFGGVRGVKGIKSTDRRRSTLAKPGALRLARALRPRDPSTLRRCSLLVSARPAARTKVGGRSLQLAHPCSVTGGRFFFSDSLLSLRSSELRIPAWERARQHWSSVSYRIRLRAMSVARPIPNSTSVPGSGTTV